MAPEPVSQPERRFVATRLDNGVETNVIASTPLSQNATTDAPLRAQQYDNARRYLADNPGVVIFVYGPTNGGPHTDDDRIWDSRVNTL